MSRKAETCRWKRPSLPASRPSEKGRLPVGVDVIDRGERAEGHALLLYPLTRAGQAIEDRRDADDLVPRLAQRRDGLERGAAGGRDVLDDEAAVAGLEQRPLDAALE